MATRYRVFSDYPCSIGRDWESVLMLRWIWVDAGYEGEQFYDDTGTDEHGNIVPLEGGQEMVRIQNGVVTPPAGAWGCNPVWWDSHMYCFPTSPRWWAFFCARHSIGIRKCRYMDLAPNYRYSGWPAPQPDSDSE